MRDLQEPLQDFLKYRQQYLSGNPNRLSPAQIVNLRLKMSTLLSELGDHIPNTRRCLSEAKNAQINEYIQLRKESCTQKDAEMQSKYNTAQALIDAEYQFNRLKQVIDGGREILNALSSKLRVMELEAKNIT